jgi:hypothetical protein
MTHLAPLGGEDFFCHFFTFVKVDAPTYTELWNMIE